MVTFLFLIYLILWLIIMSLWSRLPKPILAILIVTVLSLIVGTTNINTLKTEILGLIHHKISILDFITFLSTCYGRALQKIDHSLAVSCEKGPIFATLIFLALDILYIVSIALLIDSFISFIVKIFWSKTKKPVTYSDKYTDLYILLISFTLAFLLYYNATSATGLKTFFHMYIQKIFSGL